MKPDRPSFLTLVYMATKIPLAPTAATSSNLTINTRNRRATASTELAVRKAATIATKFASLLRIYLISHDDSLRLRHHILLRRLGSCVADIAVTCLGLVSDPIAADEVEDEHNDEGDEGEGAEGAERDAAVVFAGVEIDVVAIGVGGVADEATADGVQEEGGDAQADGPPFADGVLGGHFRGVREGWGCGLFRDWTSARKNVSSSYLVVFIRMKIC